MVKREFSLEKDKHLEIKNTEKGLTWFNKICLHNLSRIFIDRIDYAAGPWFDLEFWDNTGYRMHQLYSFSKDEVKEVIKLSKMAMPTTSVVNEDSL